MSETGTFVFARLILPQGQETWRRLQFGGNEAYAAKEAAKMLSREDVREIVTVEAEHLTYWNHEIVVNRA